MRGAKRKINSPLVSSQQVVNVRLDSEDQTNDEQAVGDNRRKREGFQSKGAKNESLDVVGQRLAFPEDIPGAVEKNITYPRVVRNSEREVLPVHWFEITEDTIHNTESGRQVRVTMRCRLEIGSVNTACRVRRRCTCAGSRDGGGSWR